MQPTQPSSTQASPLTPPTLKPKHQSALDLHHSFDGARSGADGFRGEGVQEGVGRLVTCNRRSCLHTSNKNYSLLVKIIKYAHIARVPTPNPQKKALNPNPRLSEPQTLQPTWDVASTVQPTQLSSARSSSLLQICDIRSIARSLICVTYSGLGFCL